jgi:hypothetical protein
MIADKKTEDGLRRAASKKGLRLVKSRQKNRKRADYGRYKLIDSRAGVQLTNDYVTLEVISAWLAAV